MIKSPTLIFAVKVYACVRTHVGMLAGMLIQLSTTEKKSNSELLFTRSI